LENKLNLLGVIKRGSANIGKVNRPNNNDCWNVALALACNETYEAIRKRFIKKASKNGGLYSYHYNSYLKKKNYKPYKTTCKTINKLADDTQHTPYEYVVSVKGHVVYVRHGIIYDSFKSDLHRIVTVYRRKISKRRKSIYQFFTKEVK
jgi:hypothetical protein